MKYSAPKGTFDIVSKTLKPENFWKNIKPWKFIENILKKTAEDYGFKEIRTPIFEQMELFIRSVGDSSDIISKEMYLFEDKAQRSLALRPEGTAPAIRAFIENHLQQQGNYHKLYYLGPYFRYDRPQAGRYRQFHQFGVEAIGRGDPLQDVEIIDFCNQIYKNLGIKNLEILINSVGDSLSRERFTKAFLTFLKPHFEHLSHDSKERFYKNPLRILDSKDPKDQEILKECPSILDFLSDNSKNHFNEVCRQLTKINIPYQIKTSLVRGLDYYNETVFEITSNVLGAQNSIGAGGRYNGLIKTLGGPDLPSIGFATGMERILQTMIGQNCYFGEDNAPFVYIIALDNECMDVAFNLLCRLRHSNIASEMTPKARKMQKALQEADDYKAKYVVIIGENELTQSLAQIKDMTTRKATNVSLDSVLAYIQKLSTSSS